MKTFHRGLVAALLCALATPAFAGTVYVPLSTETQGIDGLTFETQIWATNLGAVERRFDIRFIPTETDGTSGGEVTEFTVPPATTMRIDQVVATTGKGLLEVAGAPQINLRSQVTPTLDSLARLGTTLPVVTPLNVLPADSLANVQGWERSAQAETDFVLVNIGEEGSECRVEVLRADGSAVMSPTVLQMKPLSHRQFTDVLGLLNMQIVKDIRAEVSCDQPFYTYSLVTDPANGEVRVLPPTAELNASFGENPGNPGNPGPTPNGPCPDDATCFDFDGNFFTPSFQEPVRRIEMVVPPGVYRKARLNMDVLHGGWQQPTSGLHNLFWFVLNRNRDMIGYMNFRGPNQNNILIRHGLNLPQGDKPRITLPFQAQPGTTYNIDYAWDAAAGRIDVTVSAGGQIVATVFGVPNVNQLNVGGSDRFLIDIGFPPGLNPNEPPTYGWRYSNLHVEFSP